MKTNLLLIGFDEEPDQATIEREKARLIGAILKQQHCDGYISFESQRLHLDFTGLTIFGSTNGDCIVRTAGNLKFPLNWHPEKLGEFDSENFKDQIEAIQTLSNNQKIRR